MKKVLALLPFFLWAILIYVLLTAPPEDFSVVEINIPFADKIVHAILFGALVVLFGFALIKQPFQKNALKIFLMTIIASFYGIVMEFVQKYFTGNERSFSVGDMLADTIGAFLGFFIIKKIILYFNERQFIESKKNA